MAQRIQAGDEGRGVFAMHDRSRAAGWGGETDYHPRDGEARHEIHRGGIGGLAAHSVQPQITSGDWRGRDERQDSLTVTATLNRSRWSSSLGSRLTGLDPAQGL